MYMGGVVYRLLHGHPSPLDCCETEFRVTTMSASERTTIALPCERKDRLDEAATDLFVSEDVADDAAYHVIIGRLIETHPAVSVTVAE